MKKKTVEKLQASKNKKDQLKAQLAEITAEREALKAQAALEAQDDAVKAAKRFLKSLYKGDLKNDWDELKTAFEEMRAADPALKCYESLPDDEFHGFCRTVFRSVGDGFDMLRVIDSIRKNAGEELAAKYLG